MKKLFFTTIALAFVSLSASAQAVLPTSWGFATATLPNGWTATGTDYYSASGNPAPALKFDGTGDFLVINFANNPGPLTYDIAGNGFSGSTFTVQESDLGTTWTTLHQFTSLPGGTYTPTTDIPQASTRFIRFIYTNKASGNVGLDNVSIAAAPAGPQQEINVKQGTVTVINGGTYSTNSGVGATTAIPLTIENLGTVNTLNIGTPSLSGPAAADFAIGAAPATVAANGTAALTVNFTPSAAGTRNAVLTIPNNDADEDPYVINLNGIGGSFATEPASQATSLVFSNVKTYRLSAAFSPASGVDGYIVLRKKGSAITGTPADGTVYDRGDIVGDAQVVFSGTGIAFTPNNIVSNTTYHFAVFTYNGAGASRNYNTTSPLAASVTTPATMQPANYYNGISTASPTFVSDLHALINPHQVQFYSNYANLMIAKFASRDTIDNQRVVTCVYSGENKIYTEPFDFTSNNFSREHTYCHSWMPTYEAQALPEYSDYHHLFPTNQNQANSIRSNYPLGVVVTPSSSYLEGTFGLDANSRLVYEPRDAHKGDAARAMMYEATCYTTVSGNNWGFPDPISGSINYGQDQYVLKQWHFQDAPDNYERSRNDYVDSLQGNRNPFVDSIDFACFINFSNMSYETMGCLAEVEEALSASFIAYPNPAKNELKLHVDATTISAYEIVDMQGRTVLSGKADNLVLVKLNISELKSGAYIIKATTPYGMAQRPLVVE